MDWSGRYGISLGGNGFIYLCVSAYNHKIKRTAGFSCWRCVCGHIYYLCRGTIRLDDWNINTRNRASSGKNDKHKNFKHKIKTFIVRLLGCAILIYCAFFYFVIITHPEYFIVREPSLLLQERASAPHVNCDDHEVTKYKERVGQPTYKPNLNANEPILITKGFIFNSETCLVYNVPIGKNNLFVKNIHKDLFFLAYYQNILMFFIVLGILWLYRSPIKKLIKKLKQLNL